LNNVDFPIPLGPINPTLSPLYILKLRLLNNWKSSKEYGQDIADKFVRSGIKGIWNFAPTDLKVPEDVVVENVHLNESLFTLSYLLKEKFEG